MPTNVFFNHAVNTEQHLYEDLVVESLRFYGHEVYYLPREIVEEDKILGEDVQSTFGDSYQVEMYLDNVEGFDNMGQDLFSKFGVQVQEEATFTLALRTWERFISLDSNLATSLRPNEGDLIYFPLSGSLFEIRYVEDANPFYQIGKLFVFKLKCSLFEYSGEDFDTGVDAVDLVEDQNAYTIQLTMTSGSGTYYANENVTYNSAVIGEVVSWVPSTNKLTLKDVTRTLLVGDTLVGAKNSASYSISAITDILTGNANEGLATNKEFEDNETSYLDFSETNPFGEP